MSTTLDIPAIIGVKDQTNAYQAVKDQFEPTFLIELLKHTDNNKKEAAYIAGLSISTLNKKLKQHGLFVSKHVSQCGGEL